MLRFVRREPEILENVTGRRRDLQTSRANWQRPWRGNGRPPCSVVRAARACQRSVRTLRSEPERRCCQVARDHAGLRHRSLGSAVVAAEPARRQPAGVDDCCQRRDCLHTDDAARPQERAYELGLIPFLPAARGDTDGPTVTLSPSNRSWASGGLPPWSYGLRTNLDLLGRAHLSAQVLAETHSMRRASVLVSDGPRRRTPPARCRPPRPTLRGIVRSKAAMAEAPGASDTIRGESLRAVPRLVVALSMNVAMVVPLLMTVKLCSLLAPAAMTFTGVKRNCTSTVCVRSMAGNWRWTGAPAASCHSSPLHRPPRPAAQCR